MRPPAARTIRLVRELRAFLRTHLGKTECRERLERDLATREEALLHVLRHGVFAVASSPYRALLRNAGAELGDIERLARDDGVEGALARLYEAGVHLTIDEFKGRRPIVRGGLELEAKASDFDNPLAAGGVRAQTGGTSGAPRPVILSAAFLERFAVYTSLFEDAHGLDPRPVAIWQPLPPGVAGLVTALAHAKLGEPLDRWFTQSRYGPSRRAVSQALQVVAAVATRRIPVPRPTAAGEAERVARWLDRKRREGTPALFQTTPSSAVRVAQAAHEHRLDLTGTVFLLGSEPLTPRKAEVLTRAGTIARSRYVTTESGPIGIPCAAPSEAGDVHVALDSVAVIQREHPHPAGTTVGALHLTTLRESAPKLMLNVETGDHATMERRSCGCLLDRLGLGLHLDTIRSYEKLTGDGMTLASARLVELVEGHLPAAFGGGPIDYQFREEEGGDGSTRLRLLVSPRVGALREADVVAEVLRFVESGNEGEALIAQVWRGAGMLEVVREEPYATGAAKVMPLQARSRD